MRMVDGRVEFFEMSELREPIAKSRQPATAGPRNPQPPATQQQQLRKLPPSKHQANKLKIKLHQATHPL
jgi:hypothetical protein